MTNGSIVKWLVLIAVVLVTLAAVGVGRVWQRAMQDEELGHGKAWATLQYVEHKYRDVHLPGPAIRQVEGTGFVVLAIPGLGEPEGSPYAEREPPRTWLLLNEHSDDQKVRSLPEFPAYRFSCKHVPEVRKVVPHVDDYVLRHLNAICQAW